MNSKSPIFSVILAGLLILAILGLSPAGGAAQPVSAGAAAIQPAGQLEVAPAQVRTWKEMEAAAAAEATGPARPPLVKKFRPTRGEAAYKAHKAGAAQTKALAAPAAPGLESAAPLAPAVLSNNINFEGASQIGTFRPPDTHGAVGLNHFVEVTNSHLDIYQKAAPNTRVKSVSLASFFNYSAQTLFDPRAVYDLDRNRWVICADAFAESNTVQKFFFAVSQTADPLGNYFIYNVNVSDNNGLTGEAQWDFPQLGLDHNALIFTANFFDSAGNFVDARMFTVAKSLVYAGQTLTTPPHLFTGLLGTLAPPLVLDANPNSYLVAADFADNKVTLYTLTNSGAIPPAQPTLSPPATIPVPSYTAPANAPQPGTSALLDTSDSRFVNAGTQIGNSLFQVHSIDSGGFARCRFYEFDTVNRQVIQSGTYGRSSTSFDFNASIAANRSKDVFVTWSATDPTNNVNAEVRFSGRRHTDSPGVMPGSAYLLMGSNTFYRMTQDPVGAQRWGDYSAVSIDPADPTGLTAWIVNERILTSTTWGSRIGRISLPKSSLGGVNLLLLGD